MNEVPEKYRKRLTENANQFDQIVIDICNEACEHKLEAERWRLQHKDVLANCNDVSKTFAAYRETNQKLRNDLNNQVTSLQISINKALEFGAHDVDCATNDVHEKLFTGTEKVCDCWRKALEPCKCTICNDTGINQSETDTEGRLTDCACDCELGEKLVEQYADEAK